MAEFERHEPGTFCWIELGTTDQEAAKAFYGVLFGWGVHEVPIGEGQTYSMFRLGGRDVGAAYRLDPERQPGVPPHWGSYVSVASADAAAAKAKRLGGQVVVEPFDVFDSGRMAVLADPTGAVISVWEAKSHTGVGRRDEPGTLCWNELGTRDPDAAAAFYSELFGWKPLVREMNIGPYTSFLLGERPVGGMYRLTEEMGPVPPHWGMYIAVEDCDATVSQAGSLAAGTLLAPMEIAGVGRLATLRDPQGAAFSIIRLVAGG